MGFWRGNGGVVSAILFSCDARALWRFTRRLGRWISVRFSGSRAFFFLKFVEVAFVVAVVMSEAMLVATGATGSERKAAAVMEALLRAEERPGCLFLLFFLLRFWVLEFRSGWRVLAGRSLLWRAWSCVLAKGQ